MMRYLIFIFIIGVLGFLGAIEWESQNQSELFLLPEKRSSVTLILGQDKEGQQYFNLAEKHFLLDPAERTDLIVKSCHSLESMIEFLNRNSGAHPWGIINIVVHGNMWGGLSVPMWEEGPRAFPKDLFRAVNDGRLPVPESYAIDHDTRINIWACGIGKNPVLNLALEMLFTNSAGVLPEVYASPHFVIFHEVPGRMAPVRIKASYWPYFFKRGYRPGEGEIAYQMRRQYPDLTINWAAALQTSGPEAIGSEFHDEFQVPLVWTALYPGKESRPPVTTEEEKMAWIHSQPELMQKIEELEIPIEKYHWTVNKILYRHPDGRIQPAIKAIGMCTVLCVLAPEI